MAPEQARGKAVDRRADIWAFGCVVYEMLSGRRAFEADDVSMTLSLVLQREPDFAALPAAVPSNVAQTLRVCLRKDSRERASDIRDVRLALEGAFAGAPTATPGGLPPARRFRGALAWAVAAAALLLTGVSGYGWWRSTRPVERPLTVLSVDLGPDAVRAPRGALALSPDGRRLVFVGRNRNGTRQLFSRQLDQDVDTPIEGTVSDLSLSAPFFSPAGDWIGFFNGSVLRKVPVQGGPVTRVTDAGTTILGASWGDDGHIYFATQTGLMRVAASGGTAATLRGSEQSGGSVTFFAHVLPGSRAVLHNTGTAVDAATLDDLRVEVFDIITGRTKRLVDAGYEPRYLPTSARTGHIVYVSAGTLFGVGFDPRRLELTGTPVPLLQGLGSPDLLSGAAQYAVSTTGTFIHLRGITSTRAYEMSWMDAAGQLSALLPTAETYGAPRVSPDGAFVAYVRAGGKGADVWVYDVARATATQLTFTGPGLRELAWSPDSRYLVYGDGVSLWWISADGSEQPRRLLEKADNPRPFGIRADGRLLYTAFGTQGLPDLFTLPLDLSDPAQPKPGSPEPFAVTPAVEVDPAFSPDGRFIAYASNELGVNDIYVRPFPGPGGKWKVSTGGGKYPVWSRQTRELFFLGADDRIMVVNYTVDGDSFTAGTPRPWSATQIHREGVRQSFDMTPDGQRAVVFPRPTDPPAADRTLHATFLLNFFDEVRRRIPD